MCDFSPRESDDVKSGTRIMFLQNRFWPKQVFDEIRKRKLIISIDEARIMVHNGLESNFTKRHA